MKSPSPEQVKQARERIQLTLGLGITEVQKYCAELLYVKIRAWQRWETGEREMHPAFWELFKIKSKLHN